MLKYYFNLMTPIFQLFMLFAHVKYIHVLPSEYSEREPPRGPESVIVAFWVMLLYSQTTYQLDLLGKGLQCTLNNARISHVTAVVQNCFLQAVCFTAS